MLTKSKLLTLFGRRIRALREERGLTQEELGEKADLDPTYISGIERGRRNPTVVILGRLSRAFQVSISELFDGIDD